MLTLTTGFRPPGRPGTESRRDRLDVHLRIIRGMVGDLDDNHPKAEQLMRCLHRVKAAFLVYRDAEDAYARSEMMLRFYN